MNKKIAIIDYNICNVKSIFNAIKTLGTIPVLTNDKEVILSADYVILPGVGAFSKGMENLRKYDLVECIKEVVFQEKPLLGICLGMQMLLEVSYEFGLFKGLGLIKGKVIRLPEIKNQKIPNVCWNEIYEPKTGAWENTIFKNIDKNKSTVYFVHSYVVEPTDKNSILSYSNFGEFKYCSSIRQNKIFGCQFHPEKSGKVGLSILKEFINM